MAHVRFVLFLLSLTAAACHATTVPSTRPTMPASADRQAWLEPLRQALAGDETIFSVQR